MSAWRLVLGALVLGVPPGTVVAAAAPAAAAKRFVQAVRVRDVVGQVVLEPVESQPVLGRVVAVLRSADGAVTVLVRVNVSLGTGLPGFGGRTIAVPADAIAYLGPELAVTGFTPAQLQTFAAVPDEPGPASGLPGDAVIELGLTRPFH